MVRFYVKGQKLAYPFATKLLSGPFDESELAWVEMRRLRPLYPDANLSVTQQTGKRFPVRTPRSLAPTLDFDVAKVTERRRLAEALAECAREVGCAADIVGWDGEPDVDCAAPALSATIWVANLPASRVPLIHWYGAKFPLRVVPGVWPAAFNAHRTKATSSPTNWTELFDMLRGGLLAAIDGTAFETEESNR